VCFVKTHSFPLHQTWTLCWCTLPGKLKVDSTRNMWLRLCSQHVHSNLKIPCHFECCITETYKEHSLSTAQVFYTYIICCNYSWYCHFMGCRLDWNFIAVSKVATSLALDCLLEAAAILKQHLMPIPCCAVICGCFPLMCVIGTLHLWQKFCSKNLMRQNALSHFPYCISPTQTHTHTHTNCACHAHLWCFWLRHIMFLLAYAWNLFLIQLPEICFQLPQTLNL
jgi:hypothetical protein